MKRDQLEKLAKCCHALNTYIQSEGINGLIGHTSKEVANIVLMWHWGGSIPSNLVVNLEGYHES